MKLKNVHNFEDKILGAESEQMFTIDTDNHVIFDILRSKMYSDPIAAICREVASNSRDANREAGKGNVPTRITVYEPQDLLFISDMSISFEDEGPGIDPTRMGDIFLKYGASTKRGTNSQTGGFGLGAKTPFAYSDTFTVVTVCKFDGKQMKYVYTAMIDSSGKGKMVLMESEETKEKGGTKIIVPISEADRDRFEKECIKATLFWEVRPTFKNFISEIPEMEKVYTCITDGIEDWCTVYDKDGYLGSGQHWVALIDGIAYFLDSYQVKVPRSLETNHVMLINYDNGELTISANREQLQYDEETVETINARLETVKLHFTKLMKKYMKNAKTYIEACVRIKQLGNGIYRHHQNYNKLVETLPAEELLLRSLYSWLKNEEAIKSMPKVWKGRQLTTSLNIPNVNIEVVSLGDNGKSDYTDNVQLGQHWLDTPIIWKDTKVKDNKRNATLFNEYGKFIMVSPGGINIKPEYAEKQFDFVFNWGIDFKNYSEIERDESHVIENSYYKYQKQPTIDVEGYIIEKDGSGRTWGDYKSSTKYIRAEKDFEGAKDMVYAGVHSLNTQKHGAPDTTIAKARIVATLLDKKVIIINSRSIDSYCKVTKMITLDEAIKSIREDKRFADKLLIAANCKRAEQALKGVDTSLEKLFGVMHPEVPALRKIVADAKQLNISSLNPSLMGVEPTLETTDEMIEAYYEAWSNDNWVITAALSKFYWLDRIIENPNYDKEAYQHLKQIKEAYQALQVVKQLGPNNRIALQRAKQGLRARPVRTRVVNLAR